MKLEDITFVSGSKVEVFPAEDKSRQPILLEVKSVPEETYLLKGVGSNNENFKFLPLTNRS